MTLAEAAWDYAGTQLHVREKGGNNCGPEVEAYQIECGRPEDAGGEAWCASFASCCVLRPWKAGAVVLVGPPQFRAGRSGLKLWDRNPGLRIKHPRDAGGRTFIGIEDHGGGKSHVWLGQYIESGGGYTILTREGNTGPGPNVPAKDRDGNGVWERMDRRISPGLRLLRIG